jgi:cytoskeleton protein RodZ
MMDQTIGAMLRQKREEKKLSLDQVFQATKIRTNYLQAIENDRLDEIPSPAQARGFIRLYAGFLGIDAFKLFESAAPAPVRVELPEPEVIPTESTLPNKPEPAPAAEEFDTVKDRLEDLVKTGKDRLAKRVSGSSDKVKGTIQTLIDKIPFTIVRKNQAGAAPGEPVVRQASTNIPTAANLTNTMYRAMSRAIGDDLRKARESLGLSIADVERQIRIREFYLFAIEQGNFDDLPSTVQGRGMLSNYATFLNLDSEAFQSRFADVLQIRRQENQPDAKSMPIPERTVKAPISGFKRLLSADLVFTGGIFLVFFVFFVWGAFQLLNAGSESIDATTVPISDVLLSSGTPTVGEMVMVETVVPTSIINDTTLFTPAVSQEGTQTYSSSDPIQLTIAVNRRVYLQVTIDGKTSSPFRGTPGSVYSFSGKSKISLVCGDASAIQIYYNQANMGVPGIAGQVVMMDFTAKEAIDLTAKFTATPTVTQIATLTPMPTSTPTATLPPTESPTVPFVENTPTP